MTPLSEDAPSVLARRLAAPVRLLPLDALAAGWFHQTIGVRCAEAAGLAADPAFVGRVRGALGHALMAGASAEALADRPCRWEPPCAYDVLFREQARIASGLIVPRPAVIRAEAAGHDLRVELTLMGFACDWTMAAADALTAALAHGIASPQPRTAQGVPVQTAREALARHGQRPHGLTVTRRHVASAEGVAVPWGVGAAVLEFTSPVCLRGGTDLRHGLAGFVASLVDRLCGLARWQDAAVELDRRALLAAADAVRVDAAGLHRVSWQRGSRRQDRGALPMEGEVGPVVLEGPLEPLLPLLALGEVVHAGARTTFGQGAYRLTALG